MFYCLFYRKLKLELCQLRLQDPMSSCEISEEDISFEKDGRKRPLTAVTPFYNQYNFTQAPSIIIIIIIFNRT